MLDLLRPNNAGFIMGSLTDGHHVVFIRPQEAVLGKKRNLWGDNEKKPE